MYFGHGARSREFRSQPQTLVVESARADLFIGQNDHFMAKDFGTEDFDISTDDVFSDVAVAGPSTVATYSITELVDEINGVLEDSFEEGFWVWGEISGLSTKNRHTYFTLVEQEPGSRSKKAQINVNLWAGDMVKLRPVLSAAGLELADGLKVRIYGSLNFYGPFGKLSLIMRGIDPRFTLGDIALQRDELIRKLKLSGAYERNRLLDIALVPLRVGVVTSGSSAAWADFKNQILSSELGFQLKLLDVVVQGDQAVGAVTRAIETLGQRDDLDVIVVIRGGGSKSELSTFDDERIALAIANSPLPVLTGIGHEIDTSVADEVAFERHKTPTACAVSLIDRVRGFIEETESTWDAVARVATQKLSDSHNNLNNLTREISIHTRTAVDRAGERLTGRVERLLRRAPQIVLDAVTRTDNLEVRIRLLDPKNVLARGWSITRTADGRVIRSTADVSADEKITTVVADGSISSTVN